MNDTKEIDLCTKCPECGSTEYNGEDFYSNNSRICTDCGQEWFTDINYKEVVGHKG